MQLLWSTATRIASHGTRLFGALAGDSVKMYFVCEHPKSGGTWLSQMLADYLEIPLPQSSVFPIGCTSVIHNHWGYTPNLRRVFYLYRDPRDVVVSSYFGWLRVINKNDGKASSYLVRRYAPFGDPNSDLQDLRQHLTGYIKSWLKTPFGTRHSWPTHVKQWYNRSHVVSASYEQLLEDCFGILSRIIPIHTREEVDPDKLAQTIEKFSFAKRAKRTQGTEDRSSFLRKGVAGDWRNYFNREAGEVLDQYCGEMLRRLGYEKNSSWIRTLPD